MCGPAFRVKDLSNNQEIDIQIQEQIDFCNYPVGTIVKVTAEGPTIECAEIIIAGSSCKGEQNPCSDDANDYLEIISQFESGYGNATLEIVTPKYVLIDCAGGVPTTQSTEGGLEFYLDKVIKIIPADPGEGKDEICLQVQKELCTPPYPTFNLPSVVITDYFPTCVECLTVKPTTIEEVKKRSVSPGYNTPGCLPDYYDKVSCKFSESLYQEVIKKRYGIDFCCENDTDKWDIKKELLDLAAITDPDICETICPTDVVECNILCLNTDTCDLDFNTFTQFVTNGSADMTDLITSYLDYEVTDPILYAELDYFDCAYDSTYCLPLCFYLAQCYKNLESALADYIKIFKDCRQQASEKEDVLANEYAQLAEQLSSCISDITEITNQIDLLTDEITALEEAEAEKQNELAELLPGSDFIIENYDYIIAVNEELTDGLQTIKSLIQGWDYGKAETEFLAEKTAVESVITLSLEAWNTLNDLMVVNTSFNYQNKDSITSALTNIKNSLDSTQTILDTMSYTDTEQVFLQNKTDIVNHVDSAIQSSGEVQQNVTSAKEYYEQTTKDLNNEIEQLQAEINNLQNELTDKQNDLQFVQQNCANICGCSGSIEELQSFAAIVTTRRSLSQQFFVNYATQIDELIFKLQTAYSAMQNCETCDVIFPALYGGLITYTTCGGSEISMPLTPFLKIYSQVTTDYVYSNDGYELSNYEDLISSIITLSEQCDELPQCTDNTDLPNCLGEA
jgi:predicted  nucleic acid-binding Zn-ribbon protein